MTQEFELTKEIYPNQLNMELDAQGYDRGFTTRKSDGKSVIIFNDDNPLVEEVLIGHKPNSVVEESLKPVGKTQEEFRQEMIDEINAIKDINDMKDYLLKKGGLL